MANDWHELEQRLLELHRRRQGFEEHFPGWTPAEIAEALAELDRRLESVAAERLGADRIAGLLELEGRLREAFPGASVEEILAFAEAGRRLVVPELSATMEATRAQLEQELVTLEQVAHTSDPAEVAARVRARVALLAALEAA